MIPTVKLSDGNRIPILGLGTYRLNGNDCISSVKTALDLGYSHIDTAEFYGNEVEIGQAIKGYNRKDLFLTSKVWMDNLNFKPLITSCEESLKKLNVSYLDLYLIHWPNKDIPLKESLDAMEKLYSLGKIRNIGVSNFTVERLKEALKISKQPITINQVEFHPWLYQKDLYLFCSKHNIKLVAYSPIARGTFFNDPVVESICVKYKKSPSQISLRWLVQKEIIAIPKATSIEHLKENMDIFNFEIDKSSMDQLDNLKQTRLVRPDFAEF
jgi:diketogulonate reductase-like aldo/keto reductase